jgi:hypothetical protein
MFIQAAKDKESDFGGCERALNGWDFVNAVFYRI